MDAILVSSTQLTEQEKSLLGFLFKARTDGKRSSNRAVTSGRFLQSLEPAQMRGLAYLRVADQASPHDVSWPIGVIFTISTMTSTRPGQSFEKNFESQLDAEFPCFS